MAAHVDDVELKELYRYMTPEDREWLDRQALLELAIWEPHPDNKPQQQAYDCDHVDVLGYGGAAGGGKTDLGIGKGLRKHQRTIVYRQTGTEHAAFLDRMEEVLGSRDGFSGKTGIWITHNEGKRRQIEIGSVPNMGDEKKYRGRPHDLKVFEEAPEIPEQQVRFLMGWMRTTDPDQHCQTLMTFNPPTTSEGRWIIAFFAPWIDPKHPNPAKPGEVRFFARIKDKDVEVKDGKRFVLINDKPVYQFNEKQYAEVDIITPQSRTFIPARVTDNPYMKADYMRTLQNTPEPLRSQLLKGDFAAGIKDSAWQVIPTLWVEAAMARWKLLARKPEMMALGVDVARGGADETVIARRHKGLWFDEPLAYPGDQTPDGPKVAGLVVGATRDAAPQNIDVIGVGASPYDFLVQANQPVLGVNVSMTSTASDKSGMLTFKNQRSEIWWKMREALDPANNTGIALPDHPRLRADLTAPHWKLVGKEIVVESRDDIVDRIGRSPDYGTAYCLALIDTPKLSAIPGSGVPAPYDPYDHLVNGSGGGAHGQNDEPYDPYKNF